MPSSKQGKSDDSDLSRKQRDSEDAPFAKLGKYKIERKIGSGGMGAVFSAIDQDLKRRVALKVLLKDKADNPTLVKRFKAEARSAAQLEHQNIIRVYESGEINGQLYMALEFVDGIDIYQLIQKRGRIPARRSIEIIKQTCSALQHAYEANVVHRDIKPSNLMLTHNGVLKLADMGLARIVDDTIETTITRAGTTVGTVDYMAPEQARDSKAADIRSDIYSLGCTWYHMLTGSVPFPEGSMTNKLHAHATKSPPDPRLVNEEIPASIVAVIQKMMAKKKEDRYQSPAELLAELDNANLKRAEISNDSLAALAQEAEESDFEEKIRHSSKMAPDESISPGHKSSKGKSSGQKNSQNSNAKPVKTNSRNEESSSSQPEEHSKPGKYKRREKKGTEEEETPNHFQFDVKPVALISFIAILLGIGYGIITIMKGFGTVFDNNIPKAQLPLNQEAATNLTQNAVVKNALTPEQGNVPIKAPTVDEYLAMNPQKGGTNTAPNPKFTMNPSPYGQENFGTQQERLTQPVSALIDHLDKHLLHPDPTFKVSIGKPNNGVSLNESLDLALSQAHESGGVIEFTDSGPYVISKPVIIETSRIIFSASPGVTPIFVYRPSTKDKPAPMLQVNRGELQLRGIHLYLQPKLSNEQHLSEVISVKGGMLSLVDSSIVLQGNSVNDLSAIAFHNTQSPAICYVSRSSIKGDGLKSIKLESRDAKVIIKQSLMISGSSPVIMQNTLAGQLSNSLQDLNIQESLLVASQDILKFQNSAAEEKPTTVRLHTKNSIFGCSNIDNTEPLLKCIRWPKLTVNAKGEKNSKSFQWDAVNTLCTGWKKLVEMNIREESLPVTVSSEDEWNQLFDQKTSGDFMAPNTLPAFWSQSPEKVKSEEIKEFLKVAKLSQEARGKLTDLTLTDPHLLPLEQIRFDELKLDPNTVKSIPANAQILRCDLTKENLGDFLGNPKLPSRVVVEVIGVGIKQMNRCKVSNKTVRLTFPSENRAGGTSQLIIRPKAVSTANNNEKADALIELDNSELDIIGGYFQIPSTNKDGDVNWFINSKGSRLSLQNTFVEGPLIEPSRHQGLIRLQDSLIPNKCYILDSFLRTSGSSILVEDSAARIFANNSALVSFKSGIEIAPKFTSNEPEGKGLLISFNQSTFISSRDIFKITLPQKSNYPKMIGLFVSNSVFGPGLETTQQKNEATALIATNQPLEKLPDYMLWKGENNAYSNELVLTDQSEINKNIARGEPFEQQWIELWQPNQEESPHMGPDAAFLAKPIDKIPLIAPEHLVMHKGSKAADSGPNGIPLGADMSQLQIYKSENLPSNKPNNSESPNSKSPTIPNF